MEFIGADPTDPSLLTLQKDHVSEQVWFGNDSHFRARYNFWPQLPAEPVLQVICSIAFGHILDIYSTDINHHLITALIERWRPETHTFHIPCGECTVMLEDVVHLIGLPIDGKAVIGFAGLDWGELCEELLGVVPEARAMSDKRVLLSWLDTTFQELPPYVDDVVIQQHTRAFILRMIEGFLMPDTSGNRVNLLYLPFLDDLNDTFRYNWGSAVLAFMHRDLCRAAVVNKQVDIGGCLLLLQC